MKHPKLPWSEDKFQMLATSLDQECCRRANDINKLRQEGKQSLDASMETTQRKNALACSALASALEKECEQRDVLRNSLHVAMQAMTAEFEIKMADQSKQMEELRQRLDKDAEEFKAATVDRLQMISEVTEMKDVLERVTTLTLTGLRADMNGLTEAMQEGEILSDKIKLLKKPCSFHSEDR